MKKYVIKDFSIGEIIITKIEIGWERYYITRIDTDNYILYGYNIEDAARTGFVFEERILLKDIDSKEQEWKVG